MNHDPRFAAAGGQGRPAAPIDSAALIAGVVRLVSAHPGLVLEHVQAHAALLALDVAAGAGRLKRQALWWAGAFCSTLVGLMLAGVALMFWLSMPPGPASVAPAGWLLAAIPAVPLLLALVCAAGALGLFAGGAPARPGLLARLQDDLSLLRSTSS